MVTLQGLTGLPEPKSERTSKVRGSKTESTSASSAASGSSALSQDDNINISNEAQTASEINKLVQATKSQADIRAERVAAAKERIARGDYKKPEVVAKVAERLMKYLS
jgi:anti-sigma28 factor (negative regulator of flagellin synthesis)